MKRVYTSLLVLSGLAVACGRSETQGARQLTATSTAPSALTAAECDYFENGGTVRICHATGSTKNPYVIIQVSTSACVDAHSAHAGDYVATATDPDCHGGGCFPLGAPADPTIPCCDGLFPLNGTCTEPADGGGGDGGTQSDGGGTLSDGGTLPDGG